jgi:maleylpyruvate isomerase
MKWLKECTAQFLSTIDIIDDFDAPTSLPGWTRRHLIAHVHFNAEALRRLTSWARTGVETRMYASGDQRQSEIEAGARLPVERLRYLAHESAAALAMDLAALSPTEWNANVVTAQGRTIPATDIPWLRTREVAIHTIDLNAGATFDDLPPDLLRALIDDAVTKRTTQGHTAALTAWLTGRADPPDLGPWL